MSGKWSEIYCSKKGCKLCSALRRDIYNSDNYLGIPSKKDLEILSEYHYEDYYNSYCQKYEPDFQAYQVVLIDADMHQIGIDKVYNITVHIISAIYF